MGGDINSRRGFLKLCAASAGAGMLPRFTWAMEDAPRTRLTDASGQPLKASSIREHENWAFAYPYVSTPVLLMRLDDPTPRQALIYGRGARPYYWPGGVGPQRTIVAYVAICSHQLSYNSPAVSYLSYHRTRNRMSRHGRAITCCVHGSVYDPALGGQVLSGPAPFPLAAVVLEHDEKTDGLTASGLVGTFLHRDFFRAHRRDLRKAYGRKGYREEVGETTTAMPLEQWTKLVTRC